MEAIEKAFVSDEDPPLPPSAVKNLIASGDPLTLINSAPFIL